jgi:hypothetical protein
VTIPNLIGPDQLEADAVVPQCLDNQYVSDRVFNYMVRRDADYDDRTVQQMREEEIQTEFIRSLVYSSQVVINRAYLKNNNYLYKNYQPLDTLNLAAFAELVRQRAVLPFLLRESSLRDNLDIDIRSEGDRAIRALLQETGDDVTCVRLAVDEERNHRQIQALATDFGSGLTRVNFLGEERRNVMASELFTEPGYLAEGDRWKAFNESLTDLTTFVFSRGEGVTRTDVYRDWFIMEGGDEDHIALGRFRKPDRDNPFVFELKKLVDLQYNTNLPDRLDRYTFTPATLPSRTALQDDPTYDADSAQLEKLLSDDLTDALAYIRRTFMAHTQKAMNLPLLSELTVADVAELRQLPQWSAFKDSQRQILREPLRTLDLIEGFQTDFDNFQRAMSEWYNRKYQLERTEKQYANVVQVALSIAGSVVVIGVDPTGVLPKIAASAATGLIPQTIKGYAVKLLVNVIDVGEMRLDRDRSYSLDLMRTSEELTRDDVEDLIHRISRKGGMPAESTPRLAEQGKQ